MGINTCLCWACPEATLLGLRFPVFSSWPLRTQPHVGPGTWPGVWVYSESGVTPVSRCWRGASGFGSGVEVQPAECRPGSLWPSSGVNAQNCYWSLWRHRDNRQSTQDRVSDRWRGHITSEREDSTHHILEEPSKSKLSTWIRGVPCSFAVLTFLSGWS